MALGKVVASWMAQDTDSLAAVTEGGCYATFCNRCRAVYATTVRDHPPGWLAGNSLTHNQRHAMLAAARGWVCYRERVADVADANGFARFALCPDCKQWGNETLVRPATRTGAPAE